MPRVSAAKNWSRSPGLDWIAVEVADSRWDDTRSASGLTNMSVASDCADFSEHRHGGLDCGTARSIGLAVCTVFGAVRGHWNWFRLSFTKKTKGWSALECVVKNDWPVSALLRTTVLTDGECIRGSTCIS
jgi:hypothetical protein